MEFDLVCLFYHHMFGGWCTDTCHSHALLNFRHSPSNADLFFFCLIAVYIPPRARATAASQQLHIMDSHLDLFWSLMI